MEYVADTVALLRFISGARNIGKEVLSILDAADLGKNTIIIPAVLLMEILYLARSGKLGFSLSDIVEKIESHNNYQFFNLSIDVLLTAQSFSEKGLELHDWLIVATAKYLNVPLLTCDKKIISSNVVKTIWD